MLWGTSCPLVTHAVTARRWCDDQYACLIFPSVRCSISEVKRKDKAKVKEPTEASRLVWIRPPAAEWGYSRDEQQMQQGPTPGLCTRCEAGRWRRCQLQKYGRVHKPQGSGLSGHVSLGRALPAALVVPSGPGTGPDWPSADSSLLLALINCLEAAILWDGRSAARS